MMIFIGLIFYNFASGLLIYFLTSSFLGIIEQQIIRRELAAEKEQEALSPEPAPKPKSKPKPAQPTKSKQKQRQKRKKRRR
jgi:membrane protein insertase Oxa1/YidC/SpoIIIJ